MQGLFGESRRLFCLLVALLPGIPGWTVSLSAQTLQMVFAGDIMVHDGQLKAAARPDDTYDFSSSFQAIAPVLQEADLAFGNLELTLPGKPPYAGYPNFRAPDTLAGSLKKAGFDVLVTANNHSNDSGRRGILHTLEALDKRGILYTGTFADSVERDTQYPLLIERNGFRLVLLNYTYGTNNPHIPAPCVVNTIDTAQIKRDLQRARGLQPDLVIAFMHWGDEYHLDENAAQRNLAHRLFHWGADLIVGAHPHVVQPVKLLHDFSGGRLRTGLVAYSLGNFISGQIRTHTDVGLLLEVELRRHPLTKEVFLARHQYLPVWRYRGKAGAAQPPFAVVPVSAFEAPDNGWLPAADSQRMYRIVHPLRTHLRRFHSSERLVSLPAWKNEKTP